MNCFPYKETHFFDFIQFSSFLAQLCNLVAHPVGIEVTRQLLEAGKLLDIDLLDHIVVGNPRFTSLKEQMRW